MTNVAIVGIGAIGGVVSAHLCRASKVDFIVLCARTHFDVLTLETATRKFTVKPTVLTQAQDAKIADWVLFAAKAHQSDGAKDWLNALCNSDTKVAVLQNGVEHKQRVQHCVNGASILPVVVDCPAVKLNAGVIQQKGEARLTVEDSDLGREFKALFNGTAIEISLSRDIVTAAWKKLCFNVAGGAIAALTDQPLAVLHQPGMAQLAKELILECVRVGRCEGAVLKDDLADEIVESLLRDSKNSLTSMLADTHGKNIGS